jgi:hypothetical protein
MRDVAKSLLGTVDDRDDAVGKRHRRPGALGILYAIDASIERILHGVSMRDVLPGPDDLRDEARVK